MKVPLDYYYSRPTTDSVLRLAKSYYSEQLSDIDDCKFYVRGLHDTYLLIGKSPKEKYILRLYRTAWRNEGDIRFELDVLKFLGKNELNVSVPISSNQSEVFFSYEAPEGRRFGALFTYADGEPPEQQLDIEKAKLLGKSVARIHTSLDDFKSEYTRVDLDCTELIDVSITHVSKYLDEEKLSYLKLAGERIKSKLSMLNNKNANFGIVTGDINFRNFHINEQSQITHFDFDQCGYAYRVFEIGKFGSFIAPMNNKKELLQGFLDGYSEHIKLTELELKMIPFFEMASAIWVMAIAAQNELLIGYKYLESGFWEQRLSRLEKLDKELFKSI